jgi:4-diphosphocytidyl-2-C-methyl-D-erythritol kinase
VLRRNAPAKINLGLHVLRRRQDGYHDIETVFIRIPWADVLHAQPSDALHLSCTEPSLPTGVENLVVQAARRLDAGRGARLHLEKHLPAGAGLGGGSSDAAAALLLLDELWELRRPPQELRDIGVQVGSDVAFFVDGTASAIGSGRGERLEPLRDPETNEPYLLHAPLVVAVPHVQVPTAEAYRMVQPSEAKRPDLRSIILSKDLARWRAELRNDFEEPVLKAYPAIAATRAALETAGAGYVSLSGSGSAVFGIFDVDANAEAAAEALRQTGHRVWHGRVA